MFDKNLTKPKFTFLLNREGDLQTTGSLTDDSTGAVNLGAKEIGLINMSTAASDNTNAKVALNTFLNTGAVAFASSSFPAIKLVQGTENSANPPVDNRPGIKRAYESSATIQADEKVWMNIKSAKAGSYSIVALADINVSDEAEYRLRIGFFGKYHDIMYSGGTTSTPVYSPYYVSPDYSALIAAGDLSGTPEALDHLVKNLVAETNKNSAAFSLPQINRGGQQLVMALAVAADGYASGTITVNIAADVDTVTVNGVTFTEGVDYDTTGLDVLAANTIAAAITGNVTLAAAGISATAVGAVVTVIAPGAAGNSVTLATAGGGASLSGATLTGGFGVGIPTLVAGVAVPVFAYTGPNGTVTKSYTFNAEQVASLQAGAVLGTEVIVLADVTSIADVAEADSILFVGLDRPAFQAEDRLKGYKVRIEVGLTSGFTTATTFKVSNAFEGRGTLKQIQDWYIETQQRRDNDIQFRGVGVQKIEYPHDILSLAGGYYDVVIITHSTTKQGAIGTRDVNLQSTVIITPADLSGGLPTGTVDSDTLIVPTAIENWAKYNDVHIQVTYDA
jgi:hypothetical protein